MKRDSLTDLIMRAADGPLSHDEQSTLETTLAKEPAAKLEMLAAFRLEAALRALYVDEQLPQKVASAIAAAAVVGGMKAIRTPKAPRWWRWGSPKLLLSSALFLSAAVVLVGAVLWTPAVPPSSAPKVSERVQPEHTSSTGRLIRANTPSFTSPPFTPEVGSDRREVVIFSLDFEAESGPAVGEIVVGAVTTECPPREGNQRCVLAGLHHDAIGVNAIVIDARNSALGELGAFGQRRLLRFEYFIQSSTTPARMTVQMKDKEQRQNHNIRLRDAVVGRWTRAQVLIKDLRPNLFRDRFVEDGDTIRDFTILAGRLGQDLFFVDNIELIEVAAGDFGASTAGGEVTPVPSEH